MNLDVWLVLSYTSMSFINFFNNFAYQLQVLLGQEARARQKRTMSGSKIPNDDLSAWQTFLRQWWADFSVIASGVGFVVISPWEKIAASQGSWFLNTWEGRLTILLCILFSAGNIYKIIKSSKEQNQDAVIASLEKKLGEQLDPLIVTDIFVKLLYFNLDFGITERITLFKYVRSKNSFVRIARYAKNQTYNKRARVEYSVNEGCLGEAWGLDFCETEILPDYNLDKTKYLEISKKRWKLPAKTVSKLSMKSRRYCGLKIYQPGITGKPIGVIIFETISEDFPNGKTGHSIGETLTNSDLHFNDTFAWLIESCPKGISEG